MDKWLQQSKYVDIISHQCPNFPSGITSPRWDWAWMSIYFSYKSIVAITFPSPLKSLFPLATYSLISDALQNIIFCCLSMKSKQFLPEASFGLRVLSLSACVCVCMCVCVRVSVNHEFFRAITHQPFKLGSPNLDQRCKRPWLISYCFVGWLIVTFKVKLFSKVKMYPILSVCMT